MAIHAAASADRPGYLLEHFLATTALPTRGPPRTAAPKMSAPADPWTASPQMSALADRLQSGERGYLSVSPMLGAVGYRRLRCRRRSRPDKCWLQTRYYTGSRRNPSRRPQPLHRRKHSEGWLFGMNFRDDGPRNH